MPQNDATSPEFLRDGSSSGGAQKIAWVWNFDRLRIEDATDAALEFWGATSLAELKLFKFPPDDPMVQALTECASQWSDDNAAGEAPFIVLREHKAVMVRAAVSPIALSSGQSGAEVIVMNGAAAVDNGSRLRAVRGQRALATLATPVVLFTADGEQIWRNDAAERMLPQTQITIDDLFTQQELSATLRRNALAYGGTRHIAEIMTTGGPERCEIVLRRFEGERGDWELAASFSTLAEHAYPDQALQKQSRRDFFLGEAHFDSETLRLIHANATARAILKDLDIEGVTLFDIFQADIDALSHAIAAASATVVELNLSIVNEVNPGPWLHAALWITDDTLTLRFVDLGAERRNLLRLRLDQDEKHAALQSAEIGVLAIDSESSIQSINAAGALIFSQEPQALIGVTVSDLIDKASAERLSRALVAPNGGQVFDAVLTNGDTIRIAFGPPNNANADRRAIVITAANHRGGAPESQKAAPTLNNETLHAIRTELTTIRGFAELLRQNAGMPATPQSGKLYDAYLDDIASASQTIAALLKDHGQSQSAHPTAPMMTMAKEEDWDEIDLPRYVRIVADTLAVGQRPADAAVLLISPSHGAPASVKDRSALREFIELAISLAPPPTVGAITVSASPADPLADKRAILTVAGFTGDPGSAETVLTFRLMALLAERMGADLTRRSAQEVQLIFRGLQ